MGKALRPSRATAAWTSGSVNSRVMIDMVTSPLTSCSIPSAEPLGTILISAALGYRSRKAKTSPRSNGTRCSAPARTIDTGRVSRGGEGDEHEPTHEATSVAVAQISRCLCARPVTLTVPEYPPLPILSTPPLSGRRDRALLVLPRSAHDYSSQGGSGRTAPRGQGDRLARKNATLMRVAHSASG